MRGAAGLPSAYAHRSAVAITSGPGYAGSDPCARHLPGATPGPGLMSAARMQEAAWHWTDAPRRWLATVAKPQSREKLGFLRPVGWVVALELIVVLCSTACHSHWATMRPWH
jgi:hypothetical protein